tara:strand:- start:1439 stop:2164 length:726 start_codon:yes stop_codon:yes gene_type:complete
LAQGFYGYKNTRFYFLICVKQNNHQSVTLHPSTQRAQMKECIMKLLKTLLATAVAVSAMPAMAYEAGDFMIKAGVINVSPKDDNSADLGGGARVQIEDDTQLGLTFTYMISSQIGLEVLAATPFTHEVKIDGMGKVGEVSHLPPTVSLQYYPMSPESAIQPYVGVGINYTFFFDEKDAVNHVDRSTGAAFSVGANYNIDDNWMANVAVWKIDLDATAQTALDAVDLHVDPWVVLVGGGYKF